LLAGGVFLSFFGWNLKNFLGLEDTSPWFFFRLIISLENFLTILSRASISIVYVSFFCSEVLVAVELVLGLVLSFEDSTLGFPFKLNMFFSI